MSRKTRREVQEAKREYREAKSDLKTTKRSYKQAEKREEQILKPKTEAEKRYLGQKKRARWEVAGKEIKTLTANKKRAKVKKQQAIQRNGGSATQKIGRTAHQQTSQFVDTAFQDNDVLEDIASARQTIRKTHAEVRQAKKVGTYAIKVGKGSARALYGGSNRTYNLVRGKGFTRTAVQDRWETKAKNKYQRLRARFQASKTGKVTGGAKKIATKASRPILTVLKNPLSAKSYLIMFIGVLVLALLGAITGGGSSTVAQNEFDLTDSWLYLSKLDREKSDDKVDYWTNIDDVMMFMGYKHEDFTLDKKYDEKDKQWYEIKHSYRELLADVWQGLNGDKDNLKTMADIYTSTDNKYLKLSKDDQRDYDEILEQARQVGYYISYNDLENPFIERPDDEKFEPLLVTKRFGYVSKDKIYHGSVLQANKGATLYAVMDGTVRTKGTDITIKSQTAEFTYKDVSGLRVKDGDKVKAGTQIGSLASDNGLEVHYKKLKNKKKKEWAWVNVGFYLPNVEYNQTTSVLTDMNIEGDIAQKIYAIYNYLKRLDPAVTINGVSSVLGNFWTESSITAKRAEGDYLNPPIGATATSWDDPNWLSMDGPSIYGRHPNILRRGLGLGQWTDTADGSTRHTALLNYAKTKNKKWYDLELQLDFMLNGDSPYYIRTLKEILHSNDDVGTLTNQFLIYWEGNAGDKLKERQHNSQQVLQFLKQPRGGSRGGSSTLQSSWNFPSGYASKLTSYPSGATVAASLDGNTYPVGQCTWYVYNRLVEAGAPHYNWLGNGQDWVRNLVARGWKFSNTPVPGAVMSTQGGFWGTPVEYGHVSYVEYVNEDGSFLVSECNIKGVQNRIHWSIHTNASYLTFAIPPK